MTRDEVLAVIKQAEEEGWEELDLSGRGLTELPEEIGRLNQLKLLNLSRNNLGSKSYSQILTQLTSLESLDISHNKLRSLRDNFTQTNSLKSLDISFTNLASLPYWLTELTNLESLSIAGNFLGSLPDWLSKMTNLRTLEINHNKLYSLPSWLGQLTNLQSLNAQYNNLRSLPDNLAQLTNIQNLNVGSNKIRQLPDWFSQFSNLKSIKIGSNSLDSLPDVLASLINLQVLEIGSNKLNSIPDWLGQLTNLHTLVVIQNKIGSLPDSLSQLIYLQTLDINSNRFYFLADWVAQLENLRSLNISFNRFTTLPSWLTELVSLQTLDISRNNLKSLPGWITNLPNLHYLYIYKNPITEPSPEILGESLLQGTTNIEALHRYFAQIDEVGEDKIYEAKLLIIGEGGAGKTSLARKLQDPVQPLASKIGSTKGVDVIEWKFDLPVNIAQKQYHVNIWDFGGQEIYFATHQFFLTKRSVYVLVADTRRQHTDFYDWLRLQETFGGNSPILLLKNRNREQGNRFYIENLPQIQARFPNLKEIVEVDLSEVPGEKEWPWLLEKLQDYFLSLEHVGQPRPSTWVKVREALTADERDTMTREAFIQLCYDQGVKQEADALQLSDYLHNLGDILHFKDDPVLADIVVLKPTWGLDAVYRVLDNPAIVDNWGQFTYQELRSLWHELHYAGYHHQLLRLMRKFQLCYPLSNKEDTYIAPQLLHQEAPAYEWDNGENLQLRYKYPVFMPRGILSRAIVKLHDRIEEQQLVWRAGVILRDDFARAELLEMRGDSEIRIRISGRLKRDLLMEIVRALDELHRGFPKLRYDKLIPCNCGTCASLKEPHFFPLDKLQTRLEHGRNTIECDNPPFEQVNIHGLLDDGFMVRDERTGIINVGGDYISVGDIRDATGLSFGRGAAGKGG